MKDLKECGVSIESAPGYKYGNVTHLRVSITPSQIFYK